MRNIVLSALVGVFALSSATAASAQSKAKQPVPARLHFGFAGSSSPLKPQSIGFYTRGCLAGGEQLPANGPGWQAMRLSRDRAWGHPHLVQWIKDFAKASQQMGWPGLLVGDISQPRGGPMLSGHRSHQVGLDADIWLQPMPGRRLSRRERETISAMPLAPGGSMNIIEKNWQPGYVKLLKLAARDRRIERILVNPAIKKKLCEEATGNRNWLGKIRSVRGHNFHFHVRMKCPRGVGGCRAQNPPPVREDCALQIKTWTARFKPKPKRPPKPYVKPKPRPVLSIDRLPKRCRVVLTVDRPQLLAASVAPLRGVISPGRNPKRRR